MTTVAWQKFRITIPRHQLLTDHTIWQRMHFEDWDVLAPDVRGAGLERLIGRYGALATARDAWPGMTASDWDAVAQTVRAMAFVGMIEHWVDFYSVGREYGLDPRAVRRTIKAVVMTESWFDHLARGVNTDGSTDMGLGGASAFSRRTIRRWYREGRCDFVMADEDYYDPWQATRWVAFWFEAMLEEAGGDVDLAVRAYNRGIGQAVAGAGDHYLAMVRARRLRYFEGPSRSPTWRMLSQFRRERLRLSRPRRGEASIPRVSGTRSHRDTARRVSTGVQPGIGVRHAVRPTCLPSPAPNSAAAWSEAFEPFQDVGGPAEHVPPGDDAPLRAHTRPPLLPSACRSPWRARRQTPRRRRD